MRKSHFKELRPSSVIIYITDVSVIFASFFILISILRLYAFNGYISNPVGVTLHLIVFILALSLTILAVGLYNEKLRETPTGITIRLFISVLLAYFISKIFFIATDYPELPSHFSELFFTIDLFTLVIARYLVRKTPYQKIGVKRILVIGSGHRASIIEKCMRRKTDRVGLEFVGFVSMQGDSEEGVRKESILEVNSSLESYVVKNKIKEIVIAPDERRNVLPNEEFFACKRHGVEVTDVVPFLERETGQVAVNHVYPSWMIYQTNHHANFAYKAFDWLFNAIIALFIFALTWPFMLITVLAIKIEDGISAPVLYSQKRTGLNGRYFEIYKFRSMGTDAEKDGAKWAQKSDPRVTYVGNFIRKYRVDELPQLFNVLKGDMGFVGPRPERPLFIEEFEQSIPYYNHRLDVKPGLTGWAQLKYPYGSSHKDAVEKLKYDLYYIKNRSFIFDILILLRTAEIILFGKGR